MKLKTKRFLVYGVPAFLCALLAVTAVLWRTSVARAETAEQALDTKVRALYYAVSTELSDMDAALSKLTVVSSQQRRALLLADVWRIANTVETALSEAPSSHADTFATTQFVTRAGDYAYALLVQTLKGEAVSDEDRKQLGTLREQCGAIKTMTDDALDGGVLPAGQQADGGFYEQTRGEGSIPDYPRLIYDGPFSESNEELAPAGPVGDRIDESRAEEVARQWFPDGEITYDGVCDAQVRTHGFTVATDAGDVTLSLTETGGKLWYFMGSPSSSDGGAPSDAESETLHRAAQAFLKEHGYGEMHPSYAQYYAGVVVLNYAAMQDGVILYSDLIKVYVDRKTQQVIGADASGYVKNHRARELSVPAVTEDAARAAAEASMTVESVALALIPKSAGKETLCYECKGTAGGAHYILYLNAADGAEEDVFEVVNSEEGDLVV